MGGASSKLPIPETSGLTFSAVDGVFKALFSKSISSVYNYYSILTSPFTVPIED